MEMPRFLKKIGFYLFAWPFVAGEKIEDAIRVAKELEKIGIYAIINILGEHVKDEKEARRFCNEYCRLISKLFAEGHFNTHISVKPSQLGLEISVDLYRELLAKILGVAYLYLPNIKVEIDRETHEYAKAVRETSLLFAKIFPNQRVAVQINLNETLEEIRQFIEAGISIRLCKGTAYPGDIKEKKEIRQRYFEQAVLLSEKGKEPAIATLDLCLIEELENKSNLEFQVLLGIENVEMMKLAWRGQKVGFYVPCGPHWDQYGKRRWKSIVKIISRNWWYRRKR